jgi:hypothetical protein
MTYTAPVSKLLALGEEPARQDPWPDYLAMGFTREHIPELIRLMGDHQTASLPWDENDNPPDAVYGQVHAWRTLAQLDAIEAIPDLLDLFNHVDDNFSDWIQMEVPDVLGILGSPAINPCAAFLASRSINGRCCTYYAAFALVRIARIYPETYDTCVDVLTNALKKYKKQDKDLNAELILSLADLKAKEAAPLVKEVYEAGQTNTNVSMEYEFFLTEVGLLKPHWWMKAIPIGGCVLIVVIIVVIILFLFYRA